MQRCMDRIDNGLTVHVEFKLAVWIKIHFCCLHSCVLTSVYEPEYGTNLTSAGGILSRSWPYVLV